MFRKGELVGDGGEKNVYRDLDQPDRAIKEYKHPPESQELMLARGYMGRFIRLVFPEHFPELYRATSRPPQLHVDYLDVKDSDPDILAKRRRSFVEHLRADVLSVLSLPDWRKISSTLDSELKWEAVRRFKADLHEVVRHFDRNPVNFQKAKDGRLFYVDTIEPWTNVGLNFRVSNLETVIQRIPEGHDRARAVYNLTQIIRLYKARYKDAIPEYVRGEVEEAERILASSH